MSLLLLNTARYKLEEMAHLEREHSETCTTAPIHPRPAQNKVRTEHQLIQPSVASDNAWVNLENQQPISGDGALDALVVCMEGGNGGVVTPRLACPIHETH